jgi:Fic family protein
MWYRQIQTQVYPPIFFQIKEVFQLLESLESVRIEGNTTTLAELVEKTIEGGKSSDEEWQELENIQAALKFIDDYVQKGSVIDRALVSELHKLVVKNLNRDGDPTPGVYRNDSVSISNSEHAPVEPPLIQDYMDQLLAFINQGNREEKYDLLVTAITHHRFVWIHPFRNGNRFELSDQQHSVSGHCVCFE